jgi:RecA-family ATPase
LHPRRRQPHARRLDRPAARARPFILSNAEDKHTITLKRLERIAASKGKNIADLHKGGFNFLCFYDLDPILGRTDRGGIIRPTPRFTQLLEAACDIKPKIIALDTSADIFAGNENDRPQVRQFIGLLRGLSSKANCAVVVLSHPSLTGIKNKSGISGSTGWHNSVRARMLFRLDKKKKQDDDDDDDNSGVGNDDVRVLEFKKSQYSRKAESIKLRWKNGLFVPEPTIKSFTTLATEQRVNEVFLNLIARYDRQGRMVSYKPKANNYARGRVNLPPALLRASCTGTGPCCLEWRADISVKGRLDSTISPDTPFS